MSILTFQKILPRHLNTLTLPVHLYHVRHFGSTCNIVPPAREVGWKSCDLEKSQNIRVFRTEICDQFYKEIPTEIDHVSKFLEIPDDF